MRSFTVRPHGPPTIQLTRTGRPWFYRFRRIRQDREAGVLWDTQVPLARVPPEEPWKVKIVYGPSRTAREEHLPADCGTNWGFTDRRYGKSMRELRLHANDPPPPYRER